MLAILLLLMVALLVGVYADILPLQFGGKQRILREYEQKQHMQSESGASHQQ